MRCRLAPTKAPPAAPNSFAAPPNYMRALALSMDLRQKTPAEVLGWHTLLVVPDPKVG